MIGAELAVIFVIFTSQAWNMAFSMYQSLKTIPPDLDEATRGFGLSAWQRFWRLEVPFATPGLVWNMMMSMSGGWFMLVASEAVTVGNTSFQLPGIGSYIAVALAARSIHAVLFAILAMLVVILAYDQLLFRPLVAWSGKFRFETTQVDQGEDPWMLALLRRTRLLRRGGDALGAMFFAASGLRLAPRHRVRRVRDKMASRRTDYALFAVLGLVVTWAAWRIASFCLAAHLGLSDVGTALLMGFLHHDPGGGADDTGNLGVGTAGRADRAAA